MDIFMLSSLWEGLPRVIPQAMSMGLPVIANRADGVCESIQDGQTGFLCDPGNPTDMAKSCIELIDNKELRQKMGLEGQIFARENFDLRQMIRQIEDLYDSLIEANDLSGSGNKMNS